MCLTVACSRSPPQKTGMTRQFMYLTQYMRLSPLFQSASCFVFRAVGGVAQALTPSPSPARGRGERTSSIPNRHWNHTRFRR